MRSTVTIVLCSLVVVLYLLMWMAISFVDGSGAEDFPWILTFLCLSLVVLIPVTAYRALKLWLIIALWVVVAAISSYFIISG